MALIRHPPLHLPELLSFLRVEVIEKLVDGEIGLGNPPISACLLCFCHCCELTTSWLIQGPRRKLVTLLRSAEL